MRSALVASCEAAAAPAAPKLARGAAVILARFDRPCVIEFTPGGSDEPREEPAASAAASLSSRGFGRRCPLGPEREPGTAMRSVVRCCHSHCLFRWMRGVRPEEPLLSWATGISR